MKVKLFTFFCISLASANISLAQKDFDERLQAIESQFRPDGVGDDSLKIHQEYLELKQEFAEYFNTCEYQYKYYRSISKFAWDCINDEWYLRINRDSLINPLIECVGEKHPLISLTYFNIGSTLDFLGLAENKEIESYYLKCLRIENDLEEPSKFSSNIFSNIGEFFARNGDPAKSLYYNELALKKLGDYRRQVNLALLYTNKSRAHQDLGQYESALEAGLLAIEAVHKAYPSNKNETVSRKYDEVSEILILLGRYEEAEKYSKKAIEISKKYTPEYKEDLERHIVNLSKTYTFQNKFNEAEQLLLSVKNGYLNPDQDEATLRSSFFYSYMANNFFKAKRFDQSLQFCQKGLKVWFPNLSEDIISNPIIKGNEIEEFTEIQQRFGRKIESLYYIGKEAGDTKYLTSAIEATQKLDTLIKLELNEEYVEASHQAIIARNRKFYQYGLEAALLLDSLNRTSSNIEQAHKLSTRLKSQLLYKGISEKEKSQSLFSEELLSQQKEHEERIVIYERKYNEALTAEDEVGQETYFDSLFKAKETLEFFKRDHGMVETLDDDELLSTKSLKDIQSKLGEREAILEYHYFEGDLFGFLITKNEINFARSQLKPTEIIDLYGSITSNEQLDLTSISTDLLKVLEGGHDKIDRLIIIPDGELLQLPFEALEYHGEHLINFFEISYEYSSGFLFDKSEKSYSNNFEAFASDYSDANFQILKDNFTISTEGISVSPLEYTIEEVEIGVSLFGGKANINEEATKSKFKELADGNQILHLALHGAINKTFPDQSALIFNSKGSDHLLTAAEIYNLNINTDLTILSACNTGVGPVRVGDGVRSMARSFIHAGSESVITSLWEISDVTTKNILQSFYTYLKEGKSKTEALRLAKLDFIEKASPTLRHPKYWAQLVLVGDPGPIQNTGSFDFGKYLIIGVGVLLLLFLLRSFIKAKS